MEGKKYLPVLCAFAFFGHACGASMSTGRLAVQYCSRHGVLGIFGAAILYFIAAVWIFIVLEYGRLVKSKSYKDIVSGIYWDNPIVGRVMTFIWDLIQLLSIIITCASCIAGSGSLLESAFHIPYLIGMVIFVGLMMVLFLVGPGVFARLGKLSIPMFLFLVIVCIVAIYTGRENLSVVLSGNHGYTFPEGAGSLKDVLLDALTYACTNLGFVGTASLFAGNFKSTKDSFIGAFLGATLASGALVMCTIATLSTFPACIDHVLPFYEIISGLVGPGALVLYVIYILTDYIAYISTAGSLTLSGVSRYSPWIGKIIKNKKACTAVMIVFFLLCGTFLGRLGLMTIVQKGFGLVGRLRLPIWFIPVLILGPINIRRVKRKQQAAQEVTE